DVFHLPAAVEESVKVARICSVPNDLTLAVDSHRCAENRAWKGSQVDHRPSAVHEGVAASSEGIRESNDLSLIVDSVARTARTAKSSDIRHLSIAVQKGPARGVVRGIRPTDDLTVFVDALGCSIVASQSPEVFHHPVAVKESMIDRVSGGKR